MPATHFDQTQFAELLSDETAARDDVDLLVERAEMLVLDRFTETDLPGQRAPSRLRFDNVAGSNTTLHREVMLDGYDTDNAKINAELLRRLRITIALVAESLARYDKEDPRIGLVVQGSRTVSYSGAFRLLPQDWDQLLLDYDTSTRCYRI